MRGLQQRTAHALPPRFGGNGDQLDEADPAVTVLLKRHAHGAVPTRRAEHHPRIVPATTQQLVGRQPFIGERSLDKRREFVSALASPVVHYRRLFVRRLCLAVLVAALAAGCAQGAPKPGPNDGAGLNFNIKATIVIDDSGIRPDLTQGRVGDAITVTNRGTKDHGLTSESIDTGTLRPGESTTVFFIETGSIEVRDRSDPSHKARIEVSPEASS